jgi:hypothetical protein
MSMRAIEFVENWVSENIAADGQEPASSGATASALAAQCLAAATAAGILQSEIEETFPPSWRARSRKPTREKQAPKMSTATNVENIAAAMTRHPWLNLPMTRADDTRGGCRCRLDRNL